MVYDPRAGPLKLSSLSGLVRARPGSSSLIRSRPVSSQHVWTCPGSSWLVQLIRACPGSSGSFRLVQAHLGSSGLVLPRLNSFGLVRALLSTAEHSSWLLRARPGSFGLVRARLGSTEHCRALPLFVKHHPALLKACRPPLFDPCPIE